MTTYEDERRAALCEIVAKPDVFDCWRRHKQTQHGAPDRFDRYRELARKAANTRRAERLGELQ